MQVESNGITLAYSDTGTGLPIVFLHAFPLNRTMWAVQEAALSLQFRVITIDLRGHGESDAPLWHYSLDQAADDVRALLDHLSITQALFVGLSMGGYGAFKLALSHPTRFAAAASLSGALRRFSEDLAAPDAPPDWLAYLENVFGDLEDHHWLGKRPPRSGDSCCCRHE